MKYAWIPRAMCLAAVSLVACSSAAHAPFEQTYAAAPSNWAFRNRFPAADRLFNAFDYGHARVYETLIEDAHATRRLDDGEFGYITRQLLVNPPPVPLEEAAIGPRYATLVPEVVAMFEWAHMLHRQLYDVWAQYGKFDDERDAEVARMLAYYRSRPDLAVSSRPKSMDLMEGQPYSLAFRHQDPRFNGLLWSYHWLQMSLYDALMTRQTEARTSASVDATVRQFFALLDDAPRHMPASMPMSVTAAPLFSARYPEAAIIFDNLHALHDVVSDTLVSDVVPANRKRAAILAAAAAYRDDTTAVISVDEWRSMSAMMGGSPGRPPAR